MQTASGMAQVTAPSTKCTRPVLHLDQPEAQQNPGVSVQHFDSAEACAVIQPMVKANPPMGREFPFLLFLLSLLRSIAAVSNRLGCITGKPLCSRHRFMAAHDKQMYL